MKCQKCGVKIPRGTELCEACTERENKTDPSDVEEIIRELILEEEQPKKEVQPIIKERKIKNLGVNITKVILSVCILMFLISMFSPWFDLGGKATILGFVEIPTTMEAKEYLIAQDENLTDYQGKYVHASPMQLLLFTSLHIGEYKAIHNDSGEKVRSVFSLIHMIVIASLWIVIVLCFICVIFMIALKQLKSIPFVKMSLIISIILVILNIAFLKIPYINMFVIHAKDVIKNMDYINAVSITFKGIAVNSTFYPYTMTLSFTLIIAIVLLGIALVISSFLHEIKRRQDEDLREVELKAKNKGTI